jgi:Holliday junction resolvasome RuvABC endonuclease subunit
MSATLTVLALDPSSACCGYALAEVDPHRGVVSAWAEIGRFTPDRSKDEWPERVNAICREVRDAVNQWGSLDVCVIEVPKKPQQRQKNKNPAGMWVYGIAVGSIMQTVAAMGVAIEMVDPADWAKGRGDKENHKRQAAGCCPLYDAEGVKDPGGDIADAALILHWWAARERGRAAGEAQGTGQRAHGKKRRRAG